MKQVDQQEAKPSRKGPPPPPARATLAGASTAGPPSRAPGPPASWAAAAPARVPEPTVFVVNAETLGKHSNANLVAHRPGGNRGQQYGGAERGC